MLFSDGMRIIEQRLKLFKMLDQATFTIPLLVYLLNDLMTLLTHMKISLLLHNFVFNLIFLIKLTRTT